MRRSERRFAPECQQVESRTLLGSLVGAPTVKTSVVHAQALSRAALAAPPPPVMYLGEFESPVLGQGNYRYNPVVPGVYFSGLSGISGNKSAFTAKNPDAPQGKQVGFIQNNGAVTFSSQRAPISGFYCVILYATGRANYGGIQSIRLSLVGDSGGSAITTITTNSTTYNAYVTPLVYFLAGANLSVNVVGLTTAGDNTAFIDHVAILRVTTPLPLK